jgi:SH3-like domain-containing protein
MPMMKQSLIQIAMSILLLCAPCAFAEKDKLPIPRFVTIKSDEVNARTGPNLRYPIRWVLVKKGEPVEVIAEFEHWRHIRDYYGDEGWVHESMLSGKRSVVVVGQDLQSMHQAADPVAPIKALLEPGVRADLDHCQNQWCEILYGQVRGWMHRDSLWGIYPRADKSTAPASDVAW